MSKFRHNSSFWESLDQFVHTSEIIIDRPKGSRHPQITEFIYPLNYGYLKDSKASDGEEVDIWMGTAETHVVSGVLHVIDTLKRDTEIKILYSCTPQEHDLLYKVNNEMMMSGVLIER
ncbi:MAG: hypothetical protein JEZ03_07845 [Bacteroidales bacterium]|nr:hypothetical protein [Bacteroidales bacterium]